MWIRRNTYDALTERIGDLRQDNVMLRERAEGDHRLHTQVISDNRALQVQLDFMRTQVNTLSKERAILLNHVAGIKLPVPEITSTLPANMSAKDLLAAMPSFEDVGDEEAAKLGIRNNPNDGTVEYADRTDTGRD